MTDSAHPLHPWAARALLALVVGGLFTAAYRALTWSTVERERTLVILAPERTDVRIQDGPQALSTTKGVHSFEVWPGPLTLKVSHPELPPQTVPLTIPKGIGGLMIDLRYGENGTLEVGYF